MTSASSVEILPGLWRFTATHPEWTEEEGGDEGWDPVVSWWAARTSRGLVLIDPLVTDWDALDAIVTEQRGCAAVVRTIRWHERDVAPAADRYGASVWAAAAASPSGEALRVDHPLADGDELWDGVTAFDVERVDEIALWLASHSALVFGDAMLRRATGELRVCPDSWSQPAGGPARLRAVLGALTWLSVDHVLVSHGPLVLGDGLPSLAAAVS